jgi:hypothetical protein
MDSRFLGNDEKLLDFGKYSPSVDQRHAVISIVAELVEGLAGRRVPAWSRYSRLSSRTVNGSYRDNGHSTIGGRIETPANSMTACLAVFAKV